MTKMKKSALALSAAFAVSLTGGLVALNRMPAEAAIVERGYYGNQLTDGEAAAAFYDELVAMNVREGGYATGADSSLISNSKVKELAAAYETGDTSILRAFSSAVDSFSFDHSELFYVDFHAMDVRIVKSAGNYSVNMGRGKANSYLKSGITGSHTAAMIQEYSGSESGEDKGILGQFVNDLTGETVREKAESVQNKIRTSGIQYIYGDSEAARAVTDENAWTFADTAYGALKYKAADSEGYARLFCEAMKQLEVEDCVLVSGYYVTEYGVTPWTWNYVKEDNKWFAVDVASNIVNNNNDNFMATGETFFVNHYEEKKVSAASYGFTYPALATNEIAVEDSYVQKLNIKEGDGCVLVNYNGKALSDTSNSGMLDVPEEPSSGETVDTKKVKIRFMGEDTVTWGDWNYISDTGSTGIGFGSVVEEGDGISYSSITSGLATSTNYEIGIFEGETLLEYGNTNRVQSAFVYATAQSSDIRKKVQKNTGTVHIKIYYSDVLESAPAGDTDTNAPVIREVNNRGTISASKWMHMGQLDMIEFDFTPESSFTGNGVYEFVPQGLVCAKNADKKFVPFKVTFVAPSLNIARVNEDTRVYLEKAQSVSLDNNTNLDLSGWQYDDDSSAVKLSGNKQLILLVDDIDDEDEKTTLVGYLTDPENGFVDAGVVKASSAYKLTLTANGKNVLIPDSSDVKLTFAYPEGYAYGTEGISYRVFDPNSMTEYDCVATANGVVASVKALDPETAVVLIAAEEAKQTKSIITQINGTGSVTTATNSSVNCLRTEEDEVTYTITAPAGYVLEYVIFNGASVDKSTIEGGYTVKYSASLPADSVLQVGFVDETAVVPGTSSVEEAAAKALIGKQFATPGGEPEIPATVGNTKSTKTQIIILAAAIGVICLFGSIALVYCVAIRPKILKEKEEEEARIAANRERRANRNRMNAGIPPRSGPNSTAPQRPGGPQRPTPPPKKS